MTFNTTPFARRATRAVTIATVALSTLALSACGSGTDKDAERALAEQIDSGKYAGTGVENMSAAEYFGDDVAEYHIICRGTPREEAASAAGIDAGKLKMVAKDGADNKQQFLVGIDAEGKAIGVVEVPTATFNLCPHPMEYNLPADKDLPIARSSDSDPWVLMESTGDPALYGLPPSQWDRTLTPEGELLPEGQQPEGEPAPAEGEPAPQPSNG